MKYKHRASCTKCDKVFTVDSKGQPYRTQTRADQALRMHVGRFHDRSIFSATHSVALRSRKSNLVLAGGAGGKEHISGNNEEAAPVLATHGNGKLTGEQQAGILQFIRDRRSDFSSKQKCFEAALEANNGVGVIKVNGSAVERYFRRAVKALRNGHAHSRKNGHVKAHHANASESVQHETINFCQKCGSNLKVQALASVLASRLAAGSVVTVDGKKVEYAS